MKSLLLIVILLLIISCKKDGIDPIEQTENEVINTWIEENMKRYYLWNNRINTYSLDKEMDPDQFFSKIIYSEDKYSFITKDFNKMLEELTGEKKECGFGYALYSTDSGDVIGKVTYVNKDTPAEKSGLKRGMVFTKINGVVITKNNYEQLLERMYEQHSITIMGENYIETNYYLTPVSCKKEPIYKDTVYNVDDRKIGYLVYNSFVPDNGDLSQEYDIRLNDIFGKYKNENISELILDLRYNSGGYFSSSVILASLIVKNLNVKEIFAKYEYNDDVKNRLKQEFGNNYLNVYFKNNINGTPLNNIGANLKNVYVITSAATKSTSEAFINGLKPFMNVVLIGTQTAGKNTSSIILYEEDPEKQKINYCAIVPVVMKIANKLGNMDYKFALNSEIEEPLYENAPLGDIQEFMLAYTLNLIAGKQILTRAYTNNRIIPLANSKMYVENKLPK